MRLSSLDDCIQDALQTRQKLASQIDALLRSQNDRLGTSTTVDEARHSLSLVRHYAATERKQLASSIVAREKLVQSLAARKDAMHQGREAHRKAQDYLDAAETKLQECEGLLQKSRQGSEGQRRRICEDLLQIYAIEPVFSSSALP